MTESLATDSGGVASLCVPCSALVASAVSLGDTSGSLMVYDPSSAASHANVPCVGLPMAGNFTAEPVCVREDGCSLPLTRDHPPKTLYFILCFSGGKVLITGKKMRLNMPKVKKNKTNTIV